MVAYIYTNEKVVIYTNDNEIQRNVHIQATVMKLVLKLVVKSIIYNKKVRYILYQTYVAITTHFLQIS